MRFLALGAMAAGLVCLLGVLWVVLGLGGRLRALARRLAPRPPAPAARSAAPSGSPMYELRGRVAQLQLQGQQIARRNRYLSLTFLGGFILLLLVLWGVYQTQVRAYAVLGEVRIAQDPINQGRLLISFTVEAPGKVVYHRASGAIETELVRHYPAATQEAFPWSWEYEPGKDIAVSLRHRGRLLPAWKREAFPTARSADIVVLMDATESMGGLINLLKKRCAAFSKKLTDQKLAHRFCLISFGDTAHPPWQDVKPFTSDVKQFESDVDAMPHLTGGDLPESALDALELALAQPFEPGSIRHVYLVTDAQYHPKTAQSQATAEDLAGQLREKQIFLHVFSRPEFQPDYEKLLGDTGRFHKLWEFGDVLAQGRILED